MGIITEATKDKLTDLNWALSEFDRLIDVVLSNLITLEEEMHERSPEKEEIASKFHDILKFKIETVYSLMIKLEELIYNTCFAYYKKYHGLIRGEFSFLEFENVKREASYIFDSFLTQYKSLLDLVIKFAFSFYFSEQKLSWKIDSFDKLLRVVDKRDKPENVQRYSILEKSEVFGRFVNHRSSLEDITMYRHYIVHHGYVKHQLQAKSSEGYVLFSYWIPFLIKTGKSSYKIDQDKTLRIDYFCREKLYLLLTLIVDLTDTLYDDSFRQPHVNKLKKLDPQLVKEALLRICRKDVWADKVLFEDQLRAFLKSMGIDFSEMVQDITITSKENDLLAFERIYYKPLKNIRIFRNKMIFDGKPDTKPTYGVTLAGVSLNDFMSKNEELAEVLNTLRRCGLAYVIRTGQGIRYASIRDDLKSMVIQLDELSRFKWSFIQVPEMKYFRPRTPEETEISHKILGSDAEEYLKKEDEEREKLLKEYEEWKKQPEHYFENPLDIVDQNGKLISRITHKEFIKEKSVNFQNWKQNKNTTTFIDRDGRKETAVVPFFINKGMDKKRLRKLIETCEKTWQGQPKHFLDMEKESIEENKKQFVDSIKKVREKFLEVLKKYDYMIAVFRLLNEDVFA